MEMRAAKMAKARYSTYLQIYDWVKANHPGNKDKDTPAHAMELLTKPVHGSSGKTSRCLLARYGACHP